MKTMLVSSLNVICRSCLTPLAVDCYLTSLDYLVKAWRTDISDVRTRKAIRARLQVLSDSLITPDERLEQAHGPKASPYRRAASTRSATAESDTAAWQHTLPSKVSLVLNDPIVRYLLLWSSLLVLQILAVFERNQFGTDICDEVQLRAREMFTFSVCVDASMEIRYVIDDVSQVNAYTDTSCH